MNKELLDLLNVELERNHKLLSEDKEIEFAKSNINLIVNEFVTHLKLMREAPIFIPSDTSAFNGPRVFGVRL